MLNKLFNKLSQANQILESGQSTTTFLDQSIDGGYLYTLYLSGVSNPLKPKPLWIAEHTAGGNTIRNKNSGDADQRLWAALNHHRDTTLREDTQFGELVEDYRVFSDVVIWIPEKFYTLARKKSGIPLTLMVNNLQKLHRDAFGDCLVNNRQPHYCIMPQRGLAEDEVICQFGLSVFIPDEKDKLLAELSLSYQETGYPFAMWKFWESGQCIERPVGLYQGQQFLQITAERKTSSMQAPCWFEHSKGYMQINLQGSGGSSELFADGEFIREVDVGNQFNSYACRFLDATNPEDKIELKILPKDEVNAVVNETIAEDADAATRLQGLTMIFKPSAYERDVFQLLLRGISLPRFDTGLIQDQGFSHWQLGFDCAGNVNDEIDDATLKLMGYKQQEGLWLQRIGDSKAQQLKIPQDIACDDYTYRLRKSCLSEYHAFLELPTQQTYTLSKEKMSIGREQATDKNAAKIVLDILDKSYSLMMPDGKPYQVELNGEFIDLSLNYLHFSAKHIELERKEKRLFVKQCSSSAPFYILDKDYKIKKRFNPQSREIGEVNLGGYILVGYYLLQFYQPSKG